MKENLDKNSLILHVILIKVKNTQSMKGLWEILWMVQVILFMELLNQEVHFLLLLVLSLTLQPMLNLICVNLWWFLRFILTSLWQMGLLVSKIFLLSFNGKLIWCLLCGLEMKLMVYSLLLLFRLLVHLNFWLELLPLANWFLPIFLIHLFIHIITSKVSKLVFQL